MVRTKTVEGAVSHRAAGPRNLHCEGKESLLHNLRHRAGMGTSLLSHMLATKLGMSPQSSWMGRKSVSGAQRLLRVLNHGQWPAPEGIRSTAFSLLALKKTM
jgi:hypothetical protein